MKLTEFPKRGACIYKPLDLMEYLYENCPKATKISENNLRECLYVCWDINKGAIWIESSETSCTLYDIVDIIDFCRETLDTEKELISIIDKKSLEKIKIWTGDNKELCRKIQDVLFNAGFRWRNDGVIYVTNTKISYYLETLDGYIYRGEYENIHEAAMNFKDHKGKQLLPEHLGIKDKEKKSDIAYVEYKPTINKNDLIGKKIWIGNNQALKEQIQSLAFALGFAWAGIAKEDRTDKNIHYVYFTEHGNLGIYRNSNTDREEFCKITFNHKFEKEIFPKDLGIIMTSDLKTENKKITKEFLIGKKIWIGRNSALSLEVQKIAFELKIPWAGGTYTTRDNENINFLRFCKDERIRMGKNGKIDHEGYVNSEEIPIQPIDLNIVNVTTNLLDYSGTMNQEKENAQALPINESIKFNLIKPAKKEVIAVEISELPQIRLNIIKKSTKQVPRTILNIKQLNF